DKRPGGVEQPLAEWPLTHDPQFLAQEIAVCCQQLDTGSPVAAQRLALMRRKSLEHLDGIHLRQSQDEIAGLPCLAEQGGQALEQAGGLLKKTDQLGPILGSAQAALWGADVFPQTRPQADELAGADDTLIERPFGGDAAARAAGLGRFEHG